jgi:hypothetical protein
MAIIKSSWIEPGQTRKQTKRYKQYVSKLNGVNGINDLYNRRRKSGFFQADGVALTLPGAEPPLAQVGVPYPIYCIPHTHRPKNSQISPNLYPHPLLPFLSPQRDP